MRKDAQNEVDAKKQELQALKSQIKQAQQELADAQSKQKQTTTEQNLHYEDTIRKLEGTL